VTSFCHHFVEVNSRNLGGGHVCWGSYDGFNSVGWRGGAAETQVCEQLAQGRYITTEWPGVKFMTF